MLRPLLVASCVLAGCESAPPARGPELFVAPDGDDGAPGTASRPLRTLEAARDAVRLAKGAGGATVWLLAGRYARDASFVLDERDSGAADAPVIYAAAPGAAVVLDGGRVVAPERCEPVADPRILARLPAEARAHVRRIDLRALGVDDAGAYGPHGAHRALGPSQVELFLDGAPATVARWPDAGEAALPLVEVVDAGSVPRSGDFTQRGAVFRYADDRAARWARAPDAYVAGIFHFGWAFDTLRVAAVDPVARTVTTAEPHCYGLAAAPFTGWHVLNLLEELDRPGEYYVDRAGAALYFYAPDDLAGAQIQVSVLAEPLVVLDGASHVHLKGLTLEDARGLGVYLERGEGNRVADCTLRNLGLAAVQLGRGATPLPDGRHDGHGDLDAGLSWGPRAGAPGSYTEYLYASSAWDRLAGHDNGVVGCEIHDTGAGGIILGGGDRATLTRGDNFVEACDVHHVDRLDHRPAIYLDGVGNAVRGAHLHDVQGPAIVLHGNDHLIAYDEIDHVLTDASDMGAIYMGRDPSEEGHVFRYDFFHDVANPHPGGFPVSAYFFDDRSVFGGTVFGNVFLRVGSAGALRYNGGGDSPIVNSITALTPPPGADPGPLPVESAGVRQFMRDALGHRRCFEAVDIARDPFLGAYPSLYAVFDGERMVRRPVERHFDAGADLSVFVDAAALDLRLPPGSPVYERVPGFEPIPFEAIGLHRAAGAVVP